MPTYDYVCDACQHAFEKFHSMKDDPIRKCPKCAKLKVRRLLGTGGGIIFKGTGFYQTDYKPSAPPKETSKTETSKTETPKTETPKTAEPGKSEPKPSPKPDCGGKK